VTRAVRAEEVMMSRVTTVARLAALALGLGTAALALGGACARAADAPGPLRVGMASNYPPLAFKPDGELKGIEVDFAHQLGKALGREVVIVETPWNDLGTALLDNKVDVVMSGTSITEERKKKVDFTNPYLTVGQMVLIRDADYSKLRRPEALDKPTVRVGFTDNTTGARYAHKHLSKAKLQGFPDTDAGVAALRNDQIDAFVVDAPAVWRVTGGLLSKETQLRGLYVPLTHEELAWAVRKNEPQLRAQLNAVLKKWKHDGTLQDILDKWITVRKTTVEVKPQ
jgi:ABC-type amino acid transport substrate-binding protein